MLSRVALGYVEPFNLFPLFTRNCRTTLNFNFCQRFYHLPLRRALLKQIQNGFAQLGYHATVPLLLKILLVTVFTTCRSKFRPYSQKFDLDFCIQIFVRLAWFRVNGIPNNLRQVSVALIWQSFRNLYFSFLFCRCLIFLSF